MRRSFVSRAGLGALLLAVAAAVACGGGGEGEEGDVQESPAARETAADEAEEQEESSLPEPPAGKATVGGRLTRDGQPVADEEVTLGLFGKEGGEDLQTDADGYFVFEVVEPGSYWLAAGVFVEGVDMEDPFGLAWDDPCSADGFNVLNGRLSDKTTGEVKGVVASASNEESPFDVEAGDRVTHDIVFVCAAA